MKKINGLTNGIAAMLLSGMLIVGLVPGTVLASDIQRDIGQTSEIATEEVVEMHSEDIPEEASTEEGMDVEEVSTEEYSEDAKTQEEETVTSYTVTLDANGGYFANEWDDATGETVETTDILTKAIPVGGVVSIFPVRSQENAIVTFLGWSLERDGEIVSQGYEEYTPVDNCFLYAVWQVDETVAESEEASWGESVGIENQVMESVPGGTDQTDTTQEFEDTEAVEEIEAETEDADSAERAEVGLEAAEIAEETEEIFEDTEVSEESEEAEIAEEPEAEQEIEVTDATDTSDVEQEVVCTDIAVEPETDQESGDTEAKEETEEGNVEESTTSDVYNVPETEVENLMTDQQDFGSDQEAVYTDEEENTSEDISDITLSEEETQPKLIESPEEEETVREDATNGVVASGSCGDNLTWTLDEDGTLRISGTGEMYDYESYYDDDELDYVCNTPWYKHINRLQAIYIGEGVESIGKDAFEDCNAIKSITMPSSLKSIGNGAFIHCDSLTDVAIPDSVNHIGLAAFKLSGIRSIALPKKLKSIEEEVFMQSELESIVLPEELISIGERAFYCSNLKSISIPSTVTNIGVSAFSDCPLESIVIPPGTKQIESSVFYCCKELKSIIIPSNIERIGYSAFENCMSLSEIRFIGNAPVIDNDYDAPFNGVNATAYYPANDPTWTEDVRQNYGGNITWIGIFEIEDFDGDGIPDRWEDYGVDVNGDGSIDINLPEMGADPFTPDIFVEVDWMVGLYPRATALKKVYDQFSSHGINLHIDAGPDSVDYVTGKKWGDLSGGNSIAYSYVFRLGNNYNNWKIKAKNNFSKNRWKIFRYCLFVNRYDAGRGTSSSGIANNIPGQYFIVADCDGWVSGTDTALAGTFMHELGHTLGLRHGGSDDIQMKPNYLSVMNYLYQLSGLVGNNAINYSDYVLPALDETNIDETRGLDPNGITNSETVIGARWYIKKGSVYKLYKVNNISRYSLDFNKNGVIENYIQEDINKDGKKTTLSASMNDWNNISFVGGAIGNGAPLDSSEDLSMTINTDEELSNELTEEMANDLHLNPEDEQDWENVEIIESPRVIDSGECGYNASWALDDTGTLTISGTGVMSDGTHINDSNGFLIEWTSPLNGLDSRDQVKKIVIEDGITRIGEFAFIEMDNLQYVRISESVTSIGRQAFDHCISLRKIELPNKLKTIEFRAFRSCEKLTSVIIPDSVTTIETNVFEDCYKLHHVILPNNLSSVADNMFYDCRNLNSIYIPSSVKSIYTYAFKGSGLANITFGGGVTRIEQNAFEDTKLSKVDLPEGLLYIGLNSFANCSELNELNLPNSLTEIYGGAFSNCHSLKEIKIPKSVTEIKNGVFSECSSLEKVIFEGDAPNFPKYTFSSFFGEEDDYYHFSGDTITAYYPYGNSTWTEEKLQDYGGNVTWVPWKKNIRDCEISIPNDQKTVYCGKEIEPIVSVHYWEMELSAGIDYSVSYSNNTNAGTATVTISGIDKFEGITTKHFTITPAPIDSATVSGISNKTYTGSAKTQNPTVKVGDKTLKKGTDYTVSYANNTNVGTATVTITGKGNYTSKKTATFKINKAAQSITAKSKASSVAVGKTTTVSITGAKGKKSYKSSNTAIATVTSAGKVTAKKVGTVKITATSAATSNYKAASKIITIKVVPAATTSLTAANQVTGIKLTWKKVTGANGYKIYRGKTLIKTITSGSTVTFVDKKANTNGTKYVYKLVAKASTGDSTLSKTRGIYRVTRPAISSLKNSASKKMTVKWGKNAKSNGYQIQYSTSKAFASGNKIATAAGASTVSKVIASLTKGKTYYVRVRAYKTVNNVKFFSAWSTSKSVKISK